jgi:hypothetical protein
MEAAACVRACVSGRAVALLGCGGAQAQRAGGACAAARANMRRGACASLMAPMQRVNGARRPHRRSTRGRAAGRVALARHVTAATRRPGVRAVRAHAAPPPPPPPLSRPARPHAAHVPLTPRCSRYAIQEPSCGWWCPRFTPITCGVCPVTTSLSTNCTAQPPAAASCDAVPAAARHDVAGTWPRAAGGAAAARSSSSSAHAREARAPLAAAAGMAARQRRSVATRARGHARRGDTGCAGPYAAAAAAARRRRASRAAHAATPAAAAAAVRGRGRVRVSGRHARRALR